jgi:hypothetical protein
MKLLFSILFLLAFNVIKAQTFDAWKNLVKWDGVTHWSKYIIYSPGYMGVNALPIPAMGNGNLDSINSAAVTANVHFSKGDNSQNPTIYFNYNLAKNKVTLDVNYVPIEWFQMSPEMKAQRKVYWKDYYTKSALGDICANVNFRILEKWKPKIQLAFQMGLRYATSEGVGAARMTNTPGYWFNLSAGKPFNQNKNWKAIAMLGFYVWQTNNDIPRLYQDDAVTAGIGLEYNQKKIRLQTCFASYFGYVEGYNDDPIVYRFNFEKKIKNKSILLRFQQGLHDVHYTSFEAGIKLSSKN